MSNSHWIKVVKSTPEKPELNEISRFCHCSKAEAFLAFFKLFCYLDAVTADGFVPFLRKDDVVAVSGLPDMGGAMEAVGWMTFHADGARVIDWEHHNGSSAKKRLMASARQNRWRGKKGGV
jgi:hypothetical protein